MSEDSTPSKDDIMIDAAKKSGKEILSGLGKASMVFTKRMAEGAFNAQMAQAQQEETSQKIKVAGSELGKALLKGAVEGGSIGMSSILEGVNQFSKEMAKYSPPEEDPEYLDGDIEE